MKTPNTGPILTPDQVHSRFWADFLQTTGHIEAPQDMQLSVWAWCKPYSVSVKTEVTLPPEKISLENTSLACVGLQALVFYQNANNIICNIQDNIIVVLIGGKMLMGAPAHPTTQLFLITLAVIKGNKLRNDECSLGGVTVVFISALAWTAHSDGRETLGEFSPLRRKTFLLCSYAAWFIHNATCL